MSNTDTLTRANVIGLTIGLLIIVIFSGLVAVETRERLDRIEQKVNQCRP